MRWQPLKLWIPSDLYEEEAERFIETRMMVRAYFPRRDTRFNEPSITAIAGAQVAAEPVDGPMGQRLCPNCGRPTGMGNRQMVCRRCQRTGMCMGCANEGAFVDDPICYACQFGFRTRYISRVNSGVQEHPSSSPGSRDTV